MCASFLQPQVSIKTEQVDPEESQEGGITSNPDPAVPGREHKEMTPTGISAPLDATGGPGEEELGLHCPRPLGTR